ncbi:hypothetical protein [Methylomagnum ishizawai]|uniref:hypothetical protein n=1 Tax=Methylomagnum ishizawai TaxID=1760988 RepID=UPI001C33A125|nr:hypothetical protein [Methylomagnum ishizawai]BBL75468.1 hypothetical protein MishRS11D_25660 [Methylomagnum ishizawai]
MPTPTRQNLIASIRKHIAAARAYRTGQPCGVPVCGLEFARNNPKFRTHFWESCMAQAVEYRRMLAAMKPAPEPAPARTPSPSRVLFKQAHGAARLGWDLSNLPEAIQRAARAAHRPGHLECRVHDAYRTLRATFRGRPEAFRAFIRAKAGVDTIIPPT